MSPRTWRSFARREAALAQRHAEVTQALANLERDLAQMENARVAGAALSRPDREGADRAASSTTSSARTFAALQATVQAARAAVDNARASARAAEAAVENARAAIKANEAMRDVARLQLAYTTIRAPIDGRTGNLLVQPGNVLKSNEDTPLVVIAQVQPDLRVVLRPRAALTAIKKYQAGGGLKVEAAHRRRQAPRRRRPDLHQQHRGSDHRHHPAQGDVPQHRRRCCGPGQFVDVSLTLTAENAVVVPAQAVQAGAAGTVRLRGEAGPDRRVAAREGGPATRRASW